MIIKSLITFFLLLNLNDYVYGDSLPDTSIYNVNSTWISQDGKSIKLIEFRGKVVVTSMVYMGCKSSCPLTVAKMKEVEKLIPEDQKSKVQYVLFTFDLKNDTPEKMKKYAKKNHIDLNHWTFLTNKDEANVREISNLIDFKYKSLSSGEFEHSYALVALDRDGTLIGRTEGSEMNPTELANLIKKELAKK